MTPLQENETHPVVDDAKEWLKWFIEDDPVRFFHISETLYRIKDNRVVEVCAATISKLEKNTPVSDSEILGLCWFLKNMVEAHESHEPSEDQKN